MLTIERFREFVGNGIFTATFTKKDGTLRTITARLGVHSYTVGGDPEIIAKRNATITSQNMVTVFEMTKKQYRTLNLDTIKTLSANGITLEL